MKLPGAVGRGQLRVVFAEHKDRGETASEIAQLLADRFDLHISAEAIARLAETASPSEEKELTRGVDAGEGPEAEERTAEAGGGTPEPGVPPAETEIPGEEPARPPGTRASIPRDVIAEAVNAVRGRVLGRVDELGGETGEHEETPDDVESAAEPEARTPEAAGEDVEAAPADAVDDAGGAAVADETAGAGEPAAVPGETGRTPEDVVSDAVEDVVTSARSPEKGVAEPPEDVAVAAVRNNGSRPYRPVIRRLEFGGAGLEARAEAILALGEREYRGEATAAATATGRLRAVVNATLAAVEVVVGKAAKLELDGFEFQGEGRSARIVVTITLLTWDGTESHVGVALIRDGDPEHAAMRATLDALNRRLGYLLASADA